MFPSQACEYGPVAIQIKAKDFFFKEFSKLLIRLHSVISIQHRIWLGCKSHLGILLTFFFFAKHSED